MGKYLRPFKSAVFRCVGSEARPLGLNVSPGISWLWGHEQMNHSLWASVFLSVKWK